jgi:hypothetical protein
MCIFIPDTIADAASKAEKYIFEQFKDLPDSFTVLHSLRLARHRNKICSEIDFVVISEYGILCLEVKGGGISREFGQWYSVDHLNRKHKIQNPFTQSESAMHSLQDELRKRLGLHPLLSKVLFGWGVMFPDVHFNDRGPEVIPEIVYDFRDDQKLEAYIKRVYDYWRQVLKKRGVEKEKLAPSELRKLVHLLRGDFGCSIFGDDVEPYGTKVDQTDGRTVRPVEHGQ